MKYLLLFLFLLFISCTSSFEGRMINCIEQHIEDSTFYFNIDEFYNDWDSLYIFLESASYNDVAKIMGETNFEHDLSCDLFFKKERRIVKCIHFFPYDECGNASSQKIRFNFASDSYCNKFKKGEAIFKIEKCNNIYILTSK